MTTKSRDLVDLGDLSAPKGSAPWVRGCFEEAKTALNIATTRIRDAKTWLKPLRDDGGFRSLADTRGRSFLTWEVFCETAQPRGLGHSAELVDSILDEPDESKEVGSKLVAEKPKRGERSRLDKLSNPTQADRAKENGVSVPTQKKLDKLADKRPDLLERVRAHELTATRACIEAGWEITKVSIPLEPVAAAEAIRRHFPGEALDILRRELSK